MPQSFESPDQMDGNDVNPAARKSEQEYRRAPIHRAEHTEGSFTRLIEEQTAKIPSDAFLTLSLLSMAVSLYLELRDRQRPSRFVGMWVGPLLVMGVYNKLVKSLGPG